jgi:ABC-type nitrate/sulfonate/bicarbonate transport system permease component
MKPLSAKPERQQTPRTPPTDPDDVAEPPFRPDPGRRGFTHQYGLISFLSVTAFLVLWEVAYRAGWANPLFVSAPTRVAVAFWDLAQGELWTHIAASAKLLAVGFGLSVVTAIPLGILMGWYRPLAAVLDPFVSILYATPRIALIPLIFVWFGIGFGAQVVIVYLVAVFPLLINTMQGFRSIDNDLLKMSQSFMARDRSILMTIGLPASVPFMVAGMRMSLTLGLIGIVVAEFFTGSVGIGAMITRAASGLRTDNAFVGVIIIALAALLFNALLGGLERRLNRWKVVGH